MLCCTWECGPTWCTLMSLRGLQEDHELFLRYVRDNQNKAVNVLRAPEVCHVCVSVRVYLHAHASTVHNIAGSDDCHYSSGVYIEIHAEAMPGVANALILLHQDHVVINSPQDERLESLGVEAFIWV